MTTRLNITNNARLKRCRVSWTVAHQNYLRRNRPCNNIYVETAPSFKYLVLRAKAPLRGIKLDSTIAKLDFWHLLSNWSCSWRRKMQSWKLRKSNTWYLKRKSIRPAFCRKDSDSGIWNKSRSCWTRLNQRVQTALSACGICFTLSLTNPCVSKGVRATSAWSRIRSFIFDATSVKDTTALCVHFGTKHDYCSIFE